MQCSFSIENCDPTCKKYGLCSLLYQQQQINAIQEQINVLSKTIGVLVNSIEKNNEDLTENLYNYTAELLKIINSKQEGERAD